MQKQKEQQDHQPGPVAPKSPDGNLPSDGKDAMNAYFSKMSMKSDASEREFLSLDEVYKALSMVQTPKYSPQGTFDAHECTC